MDKCREDARAARPYGMTKGDFLVEGALRNCADRTLLALERESPPRV